jgi:signal transduction histidine kinase
MFFTASFLASYLVDNGYITNFNIEPYGLFGMIIFMTLLAYIIVKFKAFNTKLLATQALVWALVVLIGSEFLFIQSDINKALTAITLVIAAWLGLIIVRSVKKEIAQKEHIEKIAQELEKANIKLKELDQLKSEFVSLATHQIRAPLSAIKGYISEVFEGDFGQYSKEIEKPLQIIFQSTENLVHIVGDFLNISRIEQGTMKYELAPLDLKQVTSEIIRELQPNLDRAGLELKFEAPEGNYEVYADIGKIKQVIGNLIDNSMKYTPHGSIKISLSSDFKTQKVLFAISDTGIGIPAEVIPKLFQKFIRAKGANEVNIIGTGLGLYVAKLMIEGQQGRIWAESPGAGKGSTFYVELPVAHVS